MSNIEWQDTEELVPVEYSLEGFCLQNNLPWNEIMETRGTIAFIEKKALESLYDFLAHDTRREHGGVLLGKPYFDKISDRHFVVIQSTIPAWNTEGSAVHLQFTPETWTFISGVIEENFPDLVIVGWYHSHPGLGVFMSGTDHSTQRAFYNHPWSLAVVVDPIRHKTGWFYGEACESMDSRHVIAYTEPIIVIEPIITKPEELPAQEEIEHRKAYSLENLKWLLPVGILMISFIVTVWYFGRNRV
jgi:proteasome lid subunit RPN8/RPN11